MREQLPWYIWALVALRGRGPDRTGFWGNDRSGCSRRTIIISGEWWVATRVWGPTSEWLHLEPSRDMSLS